MTESNSTYRFRFAAALFLLQSSVFSAAEIATSEECTSGPSPLLGCTNTDPPTFTVTYPAGEIECQSALSLEQAEEEPTLSLTNHSESAGKYFTVLLVDTGDSQIHPILHYGASNIPGENLDQLVLASASPFSDYRGPDPPSYVPGIETQLFNYEWIVAEQETFVESPPPVFSNVMFSYDDYLAAVGGTTLSTSYFSSGFCVKEVDDEVPSITIPPMGTKSPKSKGTKSKTTKSPKKGYKKAKN